MKNILAPVDFSEVTPAQVDAAMVLAARTGARVHLLTVIPTTLDAAGWRLVRDDQPSMRLQYPQEDARLEALLAQALAKGVEATALILQGPPVAVVLHEADLVKADVIVVGSHGHGAMFDLLLGSVSEGVIRHARCPVMLIPSSALANLT